MLKLKDILPVCVIDWLSIDGKVINVNKQGVPDEVLGLEIKNITGFDDGLTVELFGGSTPCTHLPTGKERQK